MTFFFFLFIAFLIGVIYFATRRHQVGNVFVNAATRLGLRYSQEGTPGQKPWIYGERNGIRIDVRLFTRNQGSVRRRWTGYRLQFSDPIEISDARDREIQRRITSRLTNRFNETEVDETGLFCARSSVAEDSSRLVSDVEYLLGAARELRATALETEEPPPPAPEPEAEPEEPDRLKPPPLPGREAPDVPVTAETSPEEEPESPNLLPEPPGSESCPPEPADDELSIDLESLPEEAPDPVAPLPSSPSDEAETNPAPFTRVDSLSEAARDLFDEGRNHFEIGRHFEDAHLRRSLEGTGYLRRIERFSHDRVFGRGPGLVAELEIRELENPSGGLRVVHAVVAFPPFEDELEARATLAKWRARIGRAVTVRGTPTKCDTFAGKLFLADGLVEVAAAA